MTTTLTPSNGTEYREHAAWYWGEVVDRSLSLLDHLHGTEINPVTDPVGGLLEFARECDPGDYDLSVTSLQRWGGSLRIWCAMLPGLKTEDALRRFADIRADLDLVEAFGHSDTNQERLIAEEALGRATGNAQTAVADSKASR